jgi:6,7-dimethyl-8-ribityllumazine synthase
MAAKNKDLSKHDVSRVPPAKGMRFGIVVSEWNTNITEALYLGAYETLLNCGALPKDIFRADVPGSFELTLGAQLIAQQKQVDAVICIGCVIQGETRHFDFICDAVANGITQLNIKLNLPVIFGVLTTNNMAQAAARAGGRHGNKGVEAAVSAIKMVALQKNK